ncbi:GvpL/GvpF family gas vesicle protein [Conexibacter arvalis]|uniref:GvpL/GvpF family gas vesicle protein n=1 Tax=Conexibacter arvalis TaxID=912552 RepID=A0A840IBD9_9ACTN|nr:GvpL/GvpF family gas vesicle protein [Conexibacter arvalis]MBB4662237.1 hypothetical protein [Conexibacter arvalis]
MSAQRQRERESGGEQGRRGVWVYGVAPAGAALRELERRRDRLPEVWVVDAGDLGAIAGPAPSDDERGTRDQALAHAHVLEAAILDAPVVPFRFGIVVGDAQDVGEDLLLAHHDELAALLRRVESRLQMTLKAYYDEDALLREIVEAEPEVARLREQLRDAPEEETREQRVRLGELVGAAVDQARERDAAALLDALRPVAVAAAPDPIEREYMVCNVPLLVERDRREEFEQAVEQLAGDHAGRIRFRLLGPMPAYSFIDVEEPRWA